jgi:hypothetical protein
MPDVTGLLTMPPAARDTTGRKNTSFYLIGDDSGARGLYNTHANSRNPVAFTVHLSAAGILNKLRGGTQECGNP